jgi:prevent-host-death family protein
MPIAIRELKASLSRVLQRAQAGEIIEVTSHSKPIARIVGIPAHANEGLRGLIAAVACRGPATSRSCSPPLNWSRAEQPSAGSCWRIALDSLL